MDIVHGDSTKMEIGKYYREKKTGDGIQDANDQCFDWEDK
jgi:hypothetical protein